MKQMESEAKRYTAQEMRIRAKYEVALADPPVAENTKYSFFSPQPKPREIVL